jgi:hypothetical protein
MRHNKRFDSLGVNHSCTEELRMIQPNEEEYLEDEIEWDVFRQE